MIFCRKNEFIIDFFYEKKYIIIFIYLCTYWIPGHTNALPPGTSNGFLWQHPIFKKNNYKSGEFSDPPGSPLVALQLVLL